MPASSRDAARQGLQATGVAAERGSWNPDSLCEPRDLGILVVDGLLMRSIEVAGTRSSEILGPGDILRPWDDDAALQPVPSTTAWTVLEPITCAILDERWRLLAGRWPAFMGEVLHRIVRRSRWLAVLNAITNMRGVEGRVMLLLWHLAGNWGKVTPAGTLVPFRLTHGVIADLVGARRPSVTTAIANLQSCSDLERIEEGWLLSGDPPVSGA